MRCKPGDLAIVAGPGVLTPGLLGRLVIVEQRAEVGDLLPDENRLTPGPDGWWCRAAVTGGTLPYWCDFGLDDMLDLIEVERRPIADQVLRPFRPDEGVDESLTWCPRELQHG